MFENIPGEMKQYKSWVVWKFEDVNAKKPTKVPYCPNSGHLASVVNPSTWGTFEQAVHAVKTSNIFDGIGFVLTDLDPYAFIDLDDTKGNSTALNRQLKIFNKFDSYAEKSPSGAGLHIIVKGRLPSGRRRDSIEIYSNARYMTMTGDVYRHGPIKDQQRELDELYAQMSTGNKAAQIFAGLAKQTETDNQIIMMAQNAANGEKFAELYAGLWQNYYPSQSEADLALINIIAYYTQNRAQITRIFRNSALGQREKASRQDYLNYMLNKCFDQMLPPVDTENLKEQIEKALAEQQTKEITKTEENKNSLSNENERPQTISPQEKADQITPSKEIYSVPPGLVGEIAQFIYAQAPRPVPEIALTGALGMMAGIVGRAYNVSGTGLNQYILLLAHTGVGKEAIASGVDKLYSAVLKTAPAASDFIGPAEIASSQAIIKYMSKGPNSFTSLVGEFGIYLQQMASHNAQPHLVNLRRFMLDVYNKSGQNKVLRPTIYSDKDKNTNSIKSPSFSLLGESTPEKFYEGLHEGLISEGLLPRFTIIEYKGDRPPLSKDFGRVEPSFELIDKLSQLCANALMLNSQDKTVDIGFTNEAQTIFNTFDIYCDNQINNSERETKRQLWNRAHIKAMKLAGLVAVGCNQFDPIIDEKTAQWAINIVVADAKNLLERFESGDVGADNDESRQLDKVSDVIREYILSPWKDVEKYAGKTFSPLHNDKIIPYSYIQRKLASVAIFRKDRNGPSFALKKALNTLMDRGDIEQISKPILAKEYKKSCVAYMIASPKSFKL